EPSPETRGQLTAFVFDRLSADARNTAHKAAMAYLDKGHVEGDIVGVFAIDLALRTIQPFTTEASLIRAGLERAASQANTAFSGDRERTRDLVDTVTAAQATADGASGAAPSGPGAGSSGASIGAAAAAGALAQAVGQIQVGMLRNFEALERDQQGYASTNGLMAVVSGLKNLPGRKTVVFFSEGLAISSNESYDGKFRTISVKLSRPGLQVQTRQGYFAVRAVESAPLRSYEAPALAQLDAGTRPHAFPLETVALSFPTAKKPGLVPVLVRVPGSAVTYQLDKQDKSGKQMHLADLAVVV